MSMTEFKHNMGEIVNQVAYGGERIILVSRGKPRAALVGLEDRKKLEAAEQGEREVYVTRQRALLAEARALRRQMGRAGTVTSSVEVLEEIREERLDDILGLR